MKLINKLSKGVIAVVMCLLLATTAWAAEQIVVNYTATLDDAVFCVDELKDQAQTITLTAQAGELVAMDAFTGQVKAPEGWEIKAIANEKLNFTDGNFNLENGMIMWYSSNAENVDNDLLATVTVEIPAGTSAGQYELEFEIIDISRDWGMPWENGQVLTATLTVAEHKDGNDADHLCDTCEGEIEGVGCTYVPGEPVWADDNMTVTVTGTCACGETATAAAEAAVETTAGDCQTEAVTTYTATFTESWITEKTVTKEIKGEKDFSVHAGEQTTSYTVDGENHIVTVTCACGEVISTETVEHDFTNGDCVCGAEKPEEPTDPDPSEPDVPVTGLKGDVTLNGEVDMNDVVALMRHTLQAEILTDATALANGEVTNDDSLDMNDVVKLMQYVLKAIDSLD